MYKMNINTFSGIPLVRLLEDGRTVELAEAFSFCDSRGRIWTGNVGDQANGVSYPRMLWSISGGPWSSKSRWAAILHDIECTKRDKPWQDVHNMFGEAVRICWNDDVRAIFEFNAVWNFGPRWDEQGNIIKPTNEELDFDSIGG